VISASAAMFMRSARYWDVTQRRVVIHSDVSGQPIGPIFKDQEVQEDFTLEDGNDTLPQNVGKWLPLYAA
jgi:hypothetical protein